jgi:hypothetical protein
MVGDGLEVTIESQGDLTEKAVSNVLIAIRDAGFRLYDEGSTNDQISLTDPHPPETLSIKEAAKLVGDGVEMESTLGNDQLDLIIEIRMYGDILSIFLPPIYFYDSTYDIGRTLFSAIFLVADLHQILSAVHTFSVEKPVPQYLMDQFEAGKSSTEIISWLTIFSEESITQYSRERLLSAPAWCVKELQNVDILMILSDDIEQMKHDEIYFDVRNHLK